MLVDISPTQKVTLADEVLHQDLAGESVLLNLKSEAYFSLDDIGSQMLSALLESESIQTAYNRLLEDFEVEPEQLQKDLLAYVEKLVKDELVKVIDT